MFYLGNLDPFIFSVSALKNCPSESSIIPTPNIGFSKVIILNLFTLVSCNNFYIFFVIIIFCVITYLLHSSAIYYKSLGYNPSFPGDVRFYHDDDAAGKIVIHIRKCGGLSRAFYGIVILFKM